MIMVGSYTQDAVSRSDGLWTGDAKGEPLIANSYMVCRVFFVFFSSRRRHTRFDCDWSSDVCSSDLTSTPFFDIVARARASSGWTSALLYLPSGLVAWMIIGGTVPQVSFSRCASFSSRDRKSVV